MYEEDLQTKWEPTQGKGDRKLQLQKLICLLGLGTWKLLVCVMQAGGCRFAEEA